MNGIEFSENPAIFTFMRRHPEDIDDAQSTLVVRRSVSRRPAPCAQCDPATVEALKTAEALKLASQRHLICQNQADAIEANPQGALALARDNIGAWTTSRSHAPNYFRQRWLKMLADWTPQQICDLLRDSSQATEQLRISNPFAGLLGAELLKQISHEVYAQAAPGR